MTEEAGGVKGEKYTLPKALEIVGKLDFLNLPDPQPSIEALSLSVHYRANFDTNFEDRNAFVTGAAKFLEEATLHSDLNKLLEEGQSYAVMLYTWRCCSRALPQIKSNDQPNRKEIYEATVEVLDPEVNKLMDFMNFCIRSIDRFGNEIKRLCHKEKQKDFVSEAYLLTLGKFINMFAELDQLKNMKASVSNDYAAYRRASQFLKTMTDPELLQQSHKLSLFLAQQNKIREMVRETIRATTNHEDLLADIVQTCFQMYESRMYIEPNEKYMLIKVIGFGLYLMDNSDNNIYKTDSKKRIHLSKIDKILKKLEVVPLYGDLQIKPYQFVQDGLNFDNSKWSECESKRASPQSNILEKMDSIRENHLNYVCELAIYSKEVVTKTREKPRTDGENKNLSDLALRGLQLLSSWTQTVLEFYSWKLLHPTNHSINEKCPEEAEEYERSTRYNYSDAEKCAIVEIIAMIKGLQLLMAKMESVFMDAIRRHIYAELQDFVQLFIRDPLRKAVKLDKKRDIIKVTIMGLRDACVDWFGGVEPKDDPAFKGKKDPDDGFKIKVPRRNVGPSSTQLYMVRTMLESLIAEKSGGKKSARKDLEVAHITAIETFHKTSFFWNYLLNFNESLHSVCDLSQLWYREFFLEMTMGKRIQFPIEMSIPWILTDHILETKHAALTEYLFFPLDLYNDAALYALTKFKKQFLYLEVEAEVNLCFDQFVYKLSDQIFAHYKELAGSILLNKKFRTEVASVGHTLNFPVANRYQTLLKQRHIRLLGRTIDLNLLIGQRINAAFLNSLDVAISRFESGDITGVVELDGLIDCNRLCHRLLSKFLTLSDFDAMLREANLNVSAPYGRMTAHIAWELNYDFLTNYCYNDSTNRFVKTKLPFSQPRQRDKPPSTSSKYIWGNKNLTTAFSDIYQLYTSFIGVPHFRTMCHLLGYQDIAAIIKELSKQVKSSMKDVILPYLYQLLKVIPNVCKNHRFEYTSPGILWYYQKELKDLMQYPEIRTGVLQVFKEVGNAVLFCLLIEAAMKQEEICDLNQSAPFQNIIPRPFLRFRDGTSLEDMEEERKIAMKKLEAKYSSMCIIPVVSHFGNDQQTEMAKQGNLLTKERLCCGLSLFEMFLNTMKSFLNEDDVVQDFKDDDGKERVSIWRVPSPANGVMNIDECVEFHKIWSAIQFVFCLPVGEHEFTIEELYGEGLNWGGCVLISLLGQQMRFEAMDFCYHLLKVNRVDKKTETVNGIDMAKMIHRIRRFQILNSQIFAVINNHLSFGTGIDDLIDVEHVHCFQPPVHQPTPSEIEISEV